MDNHAQQVQCVKISYHLHFLVFQIYAHVQLVTFGSLQAVVILYVRFIFQHNLINFLNVLVALYTYQVACASSSQCDSTKGLSCPTTSGQCNCPTTSTAYNCDCDNGILLNLLLYYL